LKTGFLFVLIAGRDSLRLFISLLSYYMCVMTC